MKSAENSSNFDPKKLYLMHFSFAFASRMFDMGIVFSLAHISNNSMQIIALIGLLSTMLVFFLMPAIGKYLDQSNRLQAAKSALLVKVFCITATYFLCLLYVYLNDVSDSRYVQKLLYVIPAVAALASLSFTTITQCVEKDWVVVLTQHNSTLLTTTNATMSRIDLICASLAPAFAGFLFQYYSEYVAAVVLIIINLIATFALYFLLSSLYEANPALAQRSSSSSSSKKNNPSGMYKSIDEANADEHSPERSFCDSFTTALGLHDFFYRSGCARVMVSYAFLYMTVLSFGSIMTVFLRHAQMDDHLIGMGRGLSAITGFLGAMLFPAVSGMFGLYATSQGAIIYQWILVTLAAASFFFVDSSRIVAQLLTLSVLLSRMGLWMFDLGVRQIAQESIPEDIRGKFHSIVYRSSSHSWFDLVGAVNGKWKSMTAAFEMCSYVLAIVIAGEWSLVNII